MHRIEYFDGKDVPVVQEKMFRRMVGDLVI